MLEEAGYLPEDLRSEKRRRIGLWDIFEALQASYEIIDVARRKDL
jgi:hypothetical protein